MSISRAWFTPIIPAALGATLFACEAYEPAANEALPTAVDIDRSNAKPPAPPNIPLPPAPGSAEGEACALIPPACGPELRCENATIQHPDRPSRSLQGTCLRTCETDQDCRASSVSPPATICSPQKVCVHDLAPEGDFGNLHAPKLIDCAEDTIRFASSSATTHEFACVRTCTSDAECSGSASLGHCNINTQPTTHTETIEGFCTYALRTSGSPCSTQNPMHSCELDRERYGHLVCLDLFDQTFAQTTTSGICTQLCGDTDNDINTADVQCQAQSLDRSTPTCNYNLIASPELGVCTDQCSSFPNNCPAPHACVPFVDMCLEMDTVPSASLPVYNPAHLRLSSTILPSPSENCAGRENQCPEDTFCAIFRSTGGSPSHGGCIYGCNPTLSKEQQGCEDKTIHGSNNLICTVVNGSEDPEVGFCEVSP